jgi:sec-independent protein translocase protein TatB
MLRAMFGMGGTEILVILIVALLFLGPDKLPEAAKQISKGIRDIKKQSRVLQRTIEDDEHIGGAIRDLKSALRGEDEPIRPRPLTPPKQIAEPAEPAAAQLAPGAPEPDAAPGQPTAAPDQPAFTMPASAGEPDDAVPASARNEGGDEGRDVGANDAAELAALVKPAPNTIARATLAAAAAESPDKSEPKHG